MRYNKNTFSIFDFVSIVYPAPLLQCEEQKWRWTYPHTTFAM